MVLYSSAIMDCGALSFGDAPKQFGAQSVNKCMSVHVYDLYYERSASDVQCHIYWQYELTSVEIYSVSVGS